MSPLRDVRFGLRVLARNPGTTLIIVLALALGIGVNASSFISVNALVLNPLPYPNLSRIMTVWETIPKMRGERDLVAAANFFDWKQRSHSFDQMAAYRSWDVALTTGHDPERVQAYAVSPSFFALLGMNPAMGRAFRRDEDDPARSQVVIVSQGFWKRQMASSRDALGKTLSLSGRPYTVVGVMPEDFNYPLAAEIWTPLALTPEEKNERSVRGMLVLARLKPGLTLPQARADMAIVAAQLAKEHPNTNESREAAVTPLRELTNNVTDHFVLTLLCTAGFVLLLACANVANLQLARATGRQREIAVRTALGAGRIQIARQLVFESMLTALAGGLLGLMLADWNLSLQKFLISADVAKWVAGIRSMRIDGNVVLFTLALSFVAGLLCAAPAIWQMLRGGSSVDLNEALKEGGRSATSGRARNRLRTLLAVGEVTLALVLLIGAGLMVQAFRRLLTLDTGYNPKQLLTLQIALPASQYRDKTSMTAFYQRLLDGITTIPEVKAAAAGADLGTPEGMLIEGRPEPRPGEPRPSLHAVSPLYFEALGLPIHEGRPVAAQDGADAPDVVVVSEAVARHYWPNSSPIGQHIKLGSVRSHWLRVVGVCGDTKHWFTGEAEPAAYVSDLQAPAAAMEVLARTTADPMNIAGGVREKVRAADPNLPIFDLRSMEANIFNQLGGVRASAVSMTTYAAIALLLAVTGIYAVISYSVVQRTQEIGIRMALGAGHAAVLRLTMGQALRIAAVGLGVGVPLAAALTLVMSSVLYNVIALDPPAFVTLTALLAVAALLAGYIPARRAARIDPLKALHHS